MYCVVYIFTINALTLVDWVSGRAASLY